MPPFPWNRVARFVAAVLTGCGVGGMLVGMYPDTYRYTALPLVLLLLTLLALHAGLVIFFWRKHRGANALVVAVAFTVLYVGIAAFVSSIHKIGG